MRKKCLLFFGLLLAIILKCDVVYAADGNADLGFSGDNEAIIGSTFVQEIVVSNIQVSSGKLMGVGGSITVDNPSCLTFDSLQRVDVNSDANDAKFTYLSLAGTLNDMTIVRVNFTPGSSECSTFINIVNPTISFTNGTSLKPATISKAITVKPAASNDATLKTLIVENQTLSPEFDPEETSYSVNLPSDVTSVNIIAEANDDGAGVVGDGLKTGLLIGDNERSIIVTAADGTINIYTINLHRISNDATLKSLTVGSYTLNPTFNKDVLSYTVNIPNSVTSVSIEGIPTETSSNVDGNKTYTDLVVGDNIKTIEVTAEDNVTKKTYTVNVHRLSNDTSVSNLKITNLADNSSILYTPTFSNSDTTYNANVNNDVTNVNISFIFDGTPKTVNGAGDKSLSPGNNSFRVDVVAEDGVTKNTYTINIHRKTNEVIVSSLKITNLADNSNVAYTPTFSSTDTSYSATVNPSVSNVNISFVTNDGSIITGDGDKSLNIGDNTFNVLIKSEDGVNSKSYTINIHRKSNIITLTNLQLINLADNSNISYTPAFNKDVLSYNASVNADVNNVKIKFVSSDNTLTISGDGDKTLSNGNNTFNVNVTAEDGVTKKTYTINIKKMSNDAKLSGLKIINLDSNNEIQYTPSFNSSTLSYEAEVENNVSRINLKILKSNSLATVIGDGNKNLLIGDNTYKIKVTAEDGVTTKEYTINITRKEIITSVEFGHDISDGYIKTVANKKSDDSDTTVLDLKNQLDNDNSKLEVWTADGLTKLSDSERVATGMIVKLIVKGKLADSKIIIIKGDVNGDSDINIIDASAIVNHFLDRIYLTGPYLFASDINADETVNIIDASAIVNHFLDRIKIVFKP